MNKRITIFISILVLGTFWPGSVLRAQELWKEQEPLHVGNGIVVHFLTPRPAQGFDGTCNASWFKVRVEFDVHQDYVFTREVLFEKLFKTLLPRLRTQYCPEARRSITADIYVKGYIHGHYGRVVSAEEVEQSGLRSRGLLFVSYNAIGERSLSDPIESIVKTEQMTVSYNVQIWLDSEQEVLEGGSVSRLDAYATRGRIPIEEAEVRDLELAKVSKFKKFTEDKYGFEFKFATMPHILETTSTYADLTQAYKEVFFKSYILTTSRACRNKTVGKPIKTDLFYITASRKERSGLAIWHSASLAPKVRSSTWGNELFGWYRPHEQIAADIGSLIQYHGCASEPLRAIETAIQM